MAERRPSKRPILLLDVMGTLVHDPFYSDVPAFFGTSSSELIKVKHPTAWTRFELGQIDEAQLEREFFRDGRIYDHAGLQEAMRAAYAWLPGMEELLGRLAGAGYELHALTNYSVWWRMIEEKLALSRFLEWSFVSCERGVRKPDAEAFRGAVSELGVEPADCLVIDDRQVNVDAARAQGLDAQLFTDAASLARDLRARGLEL